MARRDSIVNAILRGARRRGLDPAAVLAVASVEGLSGGIGDAGTSFGPFQLHRGGALPGHIPLGQAQAWATSPAGLDYALNQIMRVARGKRGRQAVQAIVSQFERPANPLGEIERAMGVYGHGVSRSALMSSLNGVQQAPTPGVEARGPDVAGVVNFTNQMLGLPTLPITATPPMQARPPRATRPPRQQHVDVLPPPAKRGRTIKFLEHFAQPYGVTVTSTTSGNHVKDSYHYKGRAVDFEGDSKRMAALARAALQHPESFVEMFYTGPGHPGFFIKNGQVVPLAQLDRSVYAHHTDHVHLAS